MGKGRKARRAYILNAVLLQFRVDLGPSGSSHWLRPGHAGPVISQFAAILR
jgi:hypothetical protein